MNTMQHCHMVSAAAAHAEGCFSCAHSAALKDAAAAASFLLRELLGVRLCLRGLYALLITKALLPGKSPVLYSAAG